MNDVKDFGPYTVKNVKSFQGHDGYGFNCNLYRDGKKVAHCFDEAHGGMIDINWEGPVPKTGADKAEWKKWHDWKAKEEKLLVAHVSSLPKVKSEWGGGDLTIDEGWFVTELVNNFEKAKEIRKVRRKCETKTLFRTSDCDEGAYYIQSALFTKQLADAIRAKYGNDVEIFNEVFFNGDLPSIFA